MDTKKAATEETTAKKPHRCLGCGEELSEGWFCGACEYKKDHVRISGAELRGMNFPEKSGLVIRKKIE